MLQYEQQTEIYVLNEYLFMNLMFNMIIFYSPFTVNHFFSFFLLNFKAIPPRGFIPAA